MKEKNEFSWDKLENAVLLENHPDHTPTSLAHSYGDYLKGLGSGILQSGAEAGRQVGMTPSYIYEAFAGKPLYNLVKPDVLGFAPPSEAGDTGKEVGQTVGNIGSAISGGRLGSMLFRALSRYHPLTKGQMGRQFEAPINAAEEAGVRAPLDNNRLLELNDLLSHSALEPRGAAGRGLTPMGRHAVVQEASEGLIPGLHSAQSLLGDLERVVPGLGESSLARTRIRPLKEHILDQITRSMEKEGLGKEARNYSSAREGAKRHYQTRGAIKKAAKTVTGAALIKAGLSGLKKLP